MDRPRRVLLVDPVPLYGGDRASARFRLQPGMISIFSYLAANGVPVDVLDLHGELGVPRSSSAVAQTAAESTSRVLARDFDLLAISCNSSFHYLGALDLAQAVRAADADVPIVVGGCHATAVPSDFTGEDSPFDVVVTGEGELELVRLARELKRRPPRTQVVHGRPLPLDADSATSVDFVGYPYWDGAPHKLMFPLSRGCPYACTFCAGGARDAWRAYPPELALKLVERMMAVQPEVIALSDACFGLRPAWRRAFLRGLAALRPAQAVVLETRVETVGEEEAASLGRLDALVELGVETGSPRMAEVMHKGRDGRRYLSRADDALACLGKQGVPTHVYLLVGHPGETQESLDETLAFARRLADDPRLCAYATAHRVMLLPGSALQAEMDHWRASGARFDHPEWWKERAPQGPLADAVVTAVPRDELRRAVEEVLALRARAIAAMPPAARLTWRRVRAPLRLPKELGGLS